NAFCAASTAARTSALDASGMVAKTSRVYGFVASRRRSPSASSSLPPMSIWYRVMQRLPIVCGRTAFDRTASTSVGIKGQWAGESPASVRSRAARPKGDKADHQERQAEGQKYQRRLDDRGDRLVAHHQILEAAHCPRGRERTCEIAHPPRLEVDRPPASA